MAELIVVPDADVEREVVARDVDEMEDITGADNGTGEDPLPGIFDEPVQRTTFLDYLRSPIIQLQIGAAENQALLSVHREVLVKSPYFEKQCEEFEGVDGPYTISLPDEDLDAMGSFLEYLYNGEYFPKHIGENLLERDASIPVPDWTGEQLLRHARIYNLGDKFFMPDLKELAHKKIHATKSTARGEIVFARHVYATTSANDEKIREPIAKFWASKSHTLRHDAEDEFRAMCLEFPQFGFDVLSRVLDQKEKQLRGGGPSLTVGVGSATPAPADVSSPGTGRGKKRART